MSTIYQKRDVWYYQWTKNGKRLAKSMKTKDKAQAKRIKILWDAKLENSKLGLTPKKVSLKDSIQEFLRNKAPFLKPRSLESYTEKAAKISEICEFVSQLSFNLLAEYTTRRQAQGAANATIIKEFSVLRGTLKLLLETGKINDSPIRQWPTLKEIPKHAERIGFYSISEIEKMKEYFRGKEFEGCFLFALYTGCRRSELFGIREEHINIFENYIKLPVIKTVEDGLSGYRIISIHPALKEFLKDRRITNGILFPEILKHPRNWPHVELAKACKTLKIEYKRFHGLRHTAATYLLHSGVDLRSVMQIMGWKNLETAQRYLHHVQTMKAASQIASLPY